MANVRTFFLDFVKAEDEVASLNQAIKNTQKKLVDANALLHDMQREYHEKRTAWYMILQRIKELESLDASLQADLLRESKRMETAAGYREYEQSQKKINDISTRQVTIEADLLRLWDERDTQAPVYTHYENEYQPRVVQLEDMVRTIVAQEQQYGEQLAHARLVRDQKRQLVAGRLLEWYDRTLTIISNPVVALQGATCQGCFNMIPDKDVLRLRKGSFITCKNCYRCLYEPGTLADDSLISDEVHV